MESELSFLKYYTNSECIHFEVYSHVCGATIVLASLCRTLSRLALSSWTHDRPSQSCTRSSLVSCLVRLHLLLSESLGSPPLPP